MLAPGRPSFYLQLFSQVISPPLVFIWLWNGSLTFRGSTFCLGDQGIHVIYLQLLSLRKRKKFYINICTRNESNISWKNVITWFSLCSYWSWSLSHQCFNYLPPLEVQSWESNYVVVWETQVALQGHDWNWLPVIHLGIGFYLSASENNWRNWILEYVLGLLPNLMARFALKYPMNYWKILIPFLAARHQRTLGRGDQRGQPRRVGRLGIGGSFPSFLPWASRGAKSCCRRPLQPSLHPALSLSPFAWQACLSTFFPTSPPFPVFQVTTHRDTSSSFPSVQDLGEPPFFLSAPGDLPDMPSVTYCTTAVISLTKTFSIFVVNPRVLSSGLLPFRMLSLCEYIYIFKKQCHLQIQAALQVYMVRF